MSVFQSYLCHTLFVVLPQYAVHPIFFLFFPLYSINKIEVFLMQSVNFFLEPFMFLASCKSFCVFLFLILFLRAVFLPHS